MAESRTRFSPTTEMVYKIIQLMKELYVEFPNATPDNMIHHVFVKLQNQLNTDEDQFKEFVLKMINAYLDLIPLIGHPNTFTEQQTGWLRTRCPYYIEIHEVIENSHHYWSLAKGPSTQPTTSSASTSSKSILAALLESNQPIDWLRTPNPTWPSSDQPQIQHDSGRDVWTYGFKKKIAECMKEYFENNPESPMAEMIVAIHERLSPAVDFDSFKYSVEDMIYRYGYIQRLKANPNNSQEYIDWQLSHCPYYDDIHEALQCSRRYKEGNNFNSKRPLS